MKKSIFASLLIAAFTAAVLNSCKKPETDTETQSATDNAICEAEFTAIMPSTNSRAVKQQGISGSKIAFGAGPFVEIDSNGTTGYWPRRMWVDYDRDATGVPTAGFTDSDGRFRKGRLSMVFDTAWAVANKAKVKIDSMVKYTVNGVNYLADSITIQKNSNSYTTSVYDGECFNATWWLHWSGTRTFTLVNQGASNEEVHVTGNATGTNRSGLTYTTTIKTALVKATNCTYISSGIIDITPSGKATRTIDYSVDAAGAHNNACDNSVSLTIKGNTFIFKID